MYIKKLMKIVIITLITFVVLQPKTNIQAANKGQTATVKVDVLNVREKATTSSKKVGTLSKGNKVTVYSKTKSGWSEILYNKKKAYVSTDFLSFSTNNLKWNGIYTNYYKSNSSKEEFSQILKVTHLEKRRFLLYLNVSSTNAVGSTHVGEVEGEANYKGNKATLKSSLDGYPCKLTLTLSNNKIHIIENSCSGFHGAAVDFNGEYYK